MNLHTTPTRADDVRVRRLLAVLAALALLMPILAAPTPSAAMVVHADGDVLSIAEGESKSATRSLRGSGILGVGTGCMAPITDLSVELRVQGNNLSAFEVTLSMGGQTSTLMSGIDAFDSGDMHVVLTDEAATLLSQATDTASFDGIYHPVSPLAVFDGAAPDEQWTLTVNDTEGSNAEVQARSHVTWSLIATCTTLADEILQTGVADERVSFGGRAGPGSSTIFTPSCPGKTTDVDVTVVWEHPDDRDVRFTLTADDTTVVLRSGLGPRHGGWVVFDDEAPAPPAFANEFAPFGHPPHEVRGLVLPDQSLSAFDGLGITEWTLTMDTVPGSTRSGELQMWAIDITCTHPTLGTDAPDQGHSEDVPVSTREGGMAVAEVMIPPTVCEGMLTDLDVRLAAEHQDLGQVQMALSKDDVTVELIAGGPAGTTGGTLVFDDSARTPISDAVGRPDTMRIDGQYLPSQPLSSFDGVEGAGVWTLTVWAPQGAVGELQHLSLAPTCEARPQDTVEVLAGETRIQTAIEVSKATFPAGGQAEHIVLARADEFVDALAGTPLAVGLGTSMLLTSSTGLSADTAAELERLMVPGDGAAGGMTTVFLLGGPTAIGEQVAEDVRALGLQVDRLAGATRFETAEAIADAYVQHVGTPQEVFIATAHDFPDALIAGASANTRQAVLLLSDGDAPHPVTVDWMSTNDVPGRAIGADARRAHPGTPGIGDEDAYQTAVDVAAALHPSPTVVGIASGQAFPDGLTGGVHIGILGGPLLLTRADQLAEPTRGHLTDHAATLHTAYVYGGPAAVGEAVRDQIRDHIS